MNAPAPLNALMNTPMNAPVNAPANASVPSHANDPVAAFLRTTVGRCLRIREAFPGHRRRIIVRFVRAFELCELENREFDWFLHILRLN